MRPSSTWIYYGVGLICLLLSAWLILSPPGENGSDKAQGTEAIAEAIPADSSPSAANPSTKPDIDPVAGSEVASFILPAPQLPPPDLKGQERDAWIGEYCEQLAEASYLDGMKSLERLLAELGSPELRIAESAYHNLMARHDRRAIPYLEVRIAAATSAFEKKHLQELVDFLKTKSITETKLLKSR